MNQERRHQIQREQIYWKAQDARGRMYTQLNKALADTSGPEEAAEYIANAAKACNDWKIWAGVYASLFELSEPLA